MKKQPGSVLVLAVALLVLSCENPLEDIIQNEVATVSEAGALELYIQAGGIQHDLGSDLNAGQDVFTLALSPSAENFSILGKFLGSLSQNELIVEGQDKVLLSSGTDSPVIYPDRTPVEAVISCTSKDGSTNRTVRLNLTFPLLQKSLKSLIIQDASNADSTITISPSFKRLTPNYTATVGNSTAIVKFGATGFATNAQVSLFSKVDGETESPVTNLAAAGLGGPGTTTTFRIVCTDPVEGDNKTEHTIRIIRQASEAKLKKITIHQGDANGPVLVNQLDPGTGIKTLDSAVGTIHIMAEATQGGTSIAYKLNEGSWTSYNPDGTNPLTGLVPDQDNTVTLQVTANENTTTSITTDYTVIIRRKSNNASLATAVLWWSDQDGSNGTKQPNPAISESASQYNFNLGSSHGMVTLEYTLVNNKASAISYTSQDGTVWTAQVPNTTGVFDFNAPWLKVELTAEDGIGKKAYVFKQ